MSDNEQALDLDTIKSRVAAATAGPWERDVYEGVPNAKSRVVKRVVYSDEFGYEKLDSLADYLTRADAEFIAHAREDVPALLADVERLTAERDELAAVLEQAPHAMDSDVSYCAVYAGEGCDCWKSAAPPDVLAEVKRDAQETGFEEGVQALLNAAVYDREEERIVNPYAAAREARS